jgi:hypothetical protein
MREGETDNSGTAVFPSTTRVALPGSWVGYGGAVAFTDVVERLIPKMVSNSPGAATGVKVLRKFAEFTMPYGVTTGGSGWPCAAVTGERRINSNKTGAKFGAIFIMVTSKRPPSAAISKTTNLRCFILENDACYHRLQFQKMMFLYLLD